MSANKYGAALVISLTQSIVPVMLDSGRVVGFLSLAAPKTFNDGTSLSLDIRTGSATLTGLSNGSVPVKTVTVPPRGNDGSNPSTAQFIAVVYPQAQESSAPWNGFTEFVSNDNSGYYSNWSLPTSGAVNNFGLGVLGKVLRVNPTTPTYSAPSFSAPSASNGALTWATSMTLTNAELEESMFFDFNWQVVFAAAINAKPMRITTLTNPNGGVFKAMVVTAGGESIIPGGAQVFNTVRIIKLAHAASGTYTFTFAITDEHNLTTNVTLTLTVV